MPAAYSKDLCKKVAIKHYGLHQSYHQVAMDLVVSIGFCRSVMNRWHAGEKINAKGKRGTKTRARALTPALLGMLALRRF